MHVYFLNLLILTLILTLTLTLAIALPHTPMNTAR